MIIRSGLKIRFTRIAIAQPVSVVRIGGKPGQRQLRRRFRRKRLCGGSFTSVFNIAFQIRRRRYAHTDAVFFGTAQNNRRDFPRLRRRRISPPVAAALFPGRFFPLLFFVRLLRHAVTDQQRQRGTNHNPFIHSPFLLCVARSIQHISR